MLRKSEIRAWVRNLFVLPKKKFDKQIWLIDRGILGSMTAILAVASKENFPILVLLGALILFAVYEFIAK